MTKLNLGCGFDKRDGWLNADSFAACRPDVLMDIERLPWPFEDNRFDQILMKHVLEHVGETRSAFLGLLKELYRVCAPNCRVEIHVPHYLHETFHSDPTHLHAITPGTMEMLSKRNNRDWSARGVNYTMLALMLDVDFETESAVHVYDDYWLAKVRQGEMSRDELRERGRSHVGMIKEFQFVLRAVK